MSFENASTEVLIATARRMRDGLDAMAATPEDTWHVPDFANKKSSPLVGISCVAIVLPGLEAELAKRGVSDEQIGGTNWLPILFEASNR
jgi:hypothetical protein